MGLSGTYSCVLVIKSKSIKIKVRTGLKSGVRDGCVKVREANELQVHGEEDERIPRCAAQDALQNDDPERWNARHLHARKEKVRSALIARGRRRPQSGGIALGDACASLSTLADDTTKVG